MTPRKCYLMGISPNPLCQLCCLGIPGTMLHMLWECPKVYIFWRYVAEIISKRIGCDIPFSPATLLLTVTVNVALYLNTRVGYSLQD